MIMAPAPAASAALPNPVFEGSEKRVEIDFNFTASTPDAGLRALSRAQLDELMSLAACTIVSQRRNEFLDAYVLSESSLFVYPTKWVLKTCGTTKLLNAVPRLLEMASALGMESRRCMYSRASFLFPEQQVCFFGCSFWLRFLCVCLRMRGKQRARATRGTNSSSPPHTHKNNNKKTLQTAVPAHEL